MHRTLFILLVVASGCSSPIETGPWIEGGTIIGFNNDDPRIQIEVSDEWITATVTTYVGGPECLERHETRVQVMGQRAEITPYNRFLRAPSEGCDRALLTIEHVAEFQFDGSGDGEIIIHGMRRIDAPPFREAISVVRQVTTP